jgi:hypothetical protein
MRTKAIYTCLLLLSMVVTSCSALTNVGIRVITPSDTIISENRDVSGFKAIEYSTYGKVNIIVATKSRLTSPAPTT